MSEADELLERLADLHKQATVERSHYYVGKCVADAMDLLVHLEAERRAAVKKLCDWRSAFQSCTPGGSEWMSPEVVREHMQALRRDVVELKLENAHLRKSTNKDPTCGSRSG